MGNFGLFGDAANIDQSGFQSGLGAAGSAAASESDAGNLARVAATGSAPSAADIQMRSGLMQAQKTAAAQAASTRGNFGLAGAQRTAQGVAAGMGQQAIDTEAAQRAKEQQAGLAAYIQTTAQQRSQDLQAAGLSAQEAEAQAQLEQQQGMANQQTSSNLLGGIIGTAGSILGGLAVLSDENLKTEIVSPQDQPVTYDPNGGSGFGGSGGNFGAVSTQTQDPFYKPVSEGGAGMTPPSTTNWAGAGQAMGQGMQKAWGPLASEQLGQGGGATVPSPQDMMGYSDKRLKDQAYDRGFADAARDLPPPPAPPLDQSPGFQNAHTSAQEPMAAGPVAPKAPSGPGEQAADQFLESLQPHAFTWKDPGAAPNPEAAQGPNLGIYAQQVEQTPWGKSIVQQQPGGYKQLDIKALTTALAAGSGAMKKTQDEHAMRLAALENMVSGRAR